MSVWSFILIVLAAALVLLAFVVVRSVRKHRSDDAPLPLADGEEGSVEPAATDAAAGGQETPEALAGLAAQFRAPLALVLGSVDQLLQLDTLTPEVRSQLEIVYTNASHIERLVHQLPVLPASAEDANGMLPVAEHTAAEPEAALSPNEIFLDRLHDFMLRNMDNNELSVDDLVREMSLGRTVFFNRLKGLTGLSPIEYIRDVRIKRAAELLPDERYNITEVTYMVGMNDSRYFAKCFKQAYGITPSEYKRQHTVKKTQS